MPGIEYKKISSRDRVNRETIQRIAKILKDAIVVVLQIPADAKTS